jgi:pimeloyl-ACP methyl ester carboxylesterase
VSSDLNATAVAERTTGLAVADGRRIRWTAAGAGTPTVLLEAGLGGSADHWGQVPDGLAGVTRIMAYDRAGYGGSDPVKRITPEQVVADLDAVLADAGVTGPVVLVGHSWGGALNRLYAAQRPERVAALVLLDATHEDLRSSRSAALLRLNKAVLCVLAVHARLGLRRRGLQRSRGQLGRLLAALPEERRAAAIEELSRPAVPRQAARELTSVPLVLAATAAASAPEVPVVAVVGSKAEKPRAAKQRAELRSVYDAWTATLPDARVVLAPNSGHAVQLDDAGLVVAVVRDVVSEVRR